MPFRELCTAFGDDTLAECFEYNIFRLERIKRIGYEVNVKWECEFELPEDVEVEESLPLRTRDTPYGERTEAMRLHYNVKEGQETT